MVVFWWTNRGYWTFLVVIFTMILFSVILQAGQPFLQDRLWFWGLSFLAAATFNWILGTRWNKKRSTNSGRGTLKQRLFYRARNRFMSFPMETFSIPIAALGFGLIGYGIAFPTAYP